MVLRINGFDIHLEALDAEAQRQLVGVLRDIIEAAPLYRPSMPRSGQPYSALMTNCGTLGWVSDKEGYRYQGTHPGSGRDWPRLPEAFLTLWRRFAAWDHPPEAALINYYGRDAKLGLHVDSTEEDKTAPVLSVSLGDTAVFRMGGLERKGSTRSVRLPSGSVVVMGGPARLAHHGVDRILHGSSRLLAEGGRFSITLRRVTIPPTPQPPPTA